MADMSSDASQSLEFQGGDGQQGLLVQPRFLRELEKFLADGDDDTVITRVNARLEKERDRRPRDDHVLAKLHLVRGKAIHSKAGVPDRFDRQNREWLKEAHHSALMSVQFFEKVDDATRDRQAYADALLLEANLVARLARSSQNLHDAKGVAYLATAVESARRAEEILRELDCSTSGNAFRVLGVIWQNLNEFQTAKMYFLKAICEFRRSGQEHESIWSAVAHWNVAIALKELGHRKDALPWLKKAAFLRRNIEGPDAKYVRLYHADLVGLLKELGLFNPKNKTPERMSSSDFEVINSSLEATFNLDW